MVNIAAIAWVNRRIYITYREIEAVSIGAKWNSILAHGAADRWLANDVWMNVKWASMKIMVSLIIVGGQLVDDKPRQRPQ